MTSSPPPRRRFLPEVVDTSVRSVRHRPQDSDKASTSLPVRSAPDDTMSPATRPRKFLPQPVEESSRSSRKKEVEHVERADDKPKQPNHMSQFVNAEDSSTPDDPHGSPPKSAPRRFAAQPVETTARSARRKFAVEPTETSSRSSKDNKQEDEDTSAKPKRRFAPVLMETVTGSSKDKKATDKPKRRFAPEPVETTTSSRRQKAEPEWWASAEDGPGEVPSESSSKAPSRTSSGGRKFAPELLETAKGSYRKETHSPPRRTRSERSASPTESEEGEDEVGGLEESKFSAAALMKKHHEEHRRHSFMVPDLPIIESDSDGDESDAPSLTTSQSPSSVETDLQQMRKTPVAADSYTDYVLRLAAQTATEKELQEQAMAAYINERPHEPVAHFARDYDDEDDGTIIVGKLSADTGVDVRTFRRSSQDDHEWAMRSMRRHHAQLEEAKKQFKHDTAGQSRFSAAALATRHNLEAKDKDKKLKRARDEDSELARQRAAASPPMLGSDIVFPFTISPKMTRCDTDQVPRPRNAESSDEETEPRVSQNLWNSKVTVQTNAGGGLWGGFCHKDSQDSSRPNTPQRSGIVTPHPERANPFEAATPRGHHTPGRRGGRPFSGLHFLPLTPPRTTESHGEDLFTITIDKKLQLEKQIEDEFPDRVITQIYNYLSLGYPSLAHAFDEELSKISRIPLDDLRRDDDNVDVKGYVGAPEGDGYDEAEVMGKCKRWEALKLYVREWARQSPNFADERRRVLDGNKNQAWGAAVRKGSWGL